MESEVWQHEHSKKMHDWFSKTWLPCHKVLFISVFMLMQSSFNHLMNHHYCSLQIFNNFVKLYLKLHLYLLGCHIASIFMLTMERTWKCQNAFEYRDTKCFFRKRYYQSKGLKTFYFRQLNCSQRGISFPKNTYDLGYQVRSPFLRTEGE